MVVAAAAVEAGVLGFAFTAIKALLEVFLIGLCGYIFARNGTLNKSTLKTLSVISVNLLTPALLFSKMTETLDPALLKELWNEPVFYFIYGGFSLLWSRVGSRVLKLNGDYARLCDVATFFSNTNTLPVSLIKSIALSSGTQFLLKDANDTPLKVAARGVSYAMIFATLNNILRWSFGVALMGGMDPPSKSAFNSVNATPRMPRSEPNSGNIADTLRISIDETADADENDDEGSNDELEPLFLGSPARRLATERSQLAQLLDRVVLSSQGFWESAQKCITPPVYAIVAAFVVIMIEPLHQAFMDPDTILYTLWSAIDMCGDACVPLILISLGGQLGMMARDTTHLDSKSGDLERTDSRSSTGRDTPGATRTPSTTLLASTAMRSPAPGSSSGPPNPSIILRSATENGGSPVLLRRP
ncbi:hypothetical protein IWW38_003590, partial [Coemansia aciculifera]